jgi:hypothetical protein
MAEVQAGRRTLRSRPLPAPRGVLRCRRKFLRYYPGGFRDEDYLALERGYKWAAHERWLASLDPAAFRLLLRRGRHLEIAGLAVQAESRTNLLFSFEKMAIRDAVRTRAGARVFAEGLYEYAYGRAGDLRRFEAWRDAVAALPRIQTRVLTWPVLTVFGFLARPDVHLFLKPTVTRNAAAAYGFDFPYTSAPAWETYATALEFARRIRRDVRDLGPRDMIDLQSFIWVQGSDEYPD